MQCVGHQGLHDHFLKWQGDWAVFNAEPEDIRWERGGLRVTRWGIGVVIGQKWGVSVDFYSG